MLEEGNKPLFGNYFGTTKAIFWLAVVTSLLSVVTLGIYRFWAKTRIRRYIWSSIRIGGDPLEYTGTGLEKLLGFLVAVVVLAVYMGLVQLLLLFFGLQMFVEPQTMEQALAQIAAIYATMFAVVPLMFYAKYRARRYRFSRTRWRGIRFGMDKAAWGFTWRALLHWLVTMISFGVLMPRMDFYLEKYMTDRTHYGDAVLTQNGKWTHLYKGMKHIVIGLVLVFGSMMLLAVTEQLGLLFITVIGYFWFIIGTVSYQVFAFKYFTANKSIIGNVEFSVAPVTFEIFMRILLVGLGIGIVVGIFSAVVGGILSGIVAVDPAAFIGSAIAGVVGYIAVFVLIGALNLAWIVQPIISHIVKTVVIHNADDLDQISQRDAAEGLDGEGFADALDIGAAI